MSKSCATCLFWKSTEMEAVSPSGKTLPVQTEMMRATHGLCSWPTSSTIGNKVMRCVPDWMNRQAGGGYLTAEDDGKNCTAYDQAGGS